MSRMSRREMVVWQCAYIFLWAEFILSKSFLARLYFSMYFGAGTNQGTLTDEFSKT